MKYHRSHNFDKFIKVAKADFLRQYFKMRNHDIPASQEIAPDLVHKLLDSIAKEDDRLDIEDELLCLNDISDRTDILEATEDQFKIKIEDNDAAETRALRIFLHKDPEAFEQAYDHYLCIVRGERINYYPLPSDTFNFNDSTLNQFKAEMQKYLKERHKTDNCYIRDRVYQGKHYILIARGDSPKTVHELEGKKLKPRVYRPAKEDILVYNKEASVFGINSGVKGKAEKEFYLKTFAKHVLGQASINNEVFSPDSKLIDLKPLLKQDFYVKNDDIADIKLTELFVIHYSTVPTDIILKSDDILQSLKDLPFSIGKNQIVSARVDFFFKGKKRSVPVQMTSRGCAQIKHRKESKIIEDYLREKKVRAF